MATSSITRRGLLRAAGAVAVLVVGGGVWRASEQGVFAVGTGPAYEPWHDWRGGSGRQSMNLVRAAILAANAHNAQPWLFHVSDDAIAVFADHARNIGGMDPLRREMYVSLGCALENLCLAGAACGYDVQLKTMPDPSDPTCVADIALLPAEPKSSLLYDAIPDRHTDRAAFDTTQRLESRKLDELSRLVTSPVTKLIWFSDPANMKRIGETTVAATEAISADAGMADSSARWFRSSWSDVQKYRDGITLDAQGMTPLMTFLGKMAPALSEQQADGYWVQSTRDAQTATAAAYGILAIPDFPNRAQLLEAGRLWQRLHLSATASHLAMQPLNQIVERTDREVQEGLSARFGGELQELVGETPWRGVFLFRIGYPLQTPSASPRRSINQVMV